MCTVMPRAGVACAVLCVPTGARPEESGQLIGRGLLGVDVALQLATEGVGEIELPQPMAMATATRSRR